MLIAADAELPDTEIERKPQPFLRWAGGKRWLVPKISRWLSGTEIGAFHEPFLGGGAVFFGLDLPGASHLSDMNDELIATYRAVRDDYATVSKLLEVWTNDEDVYYSVRSDQPDGLAARAARFIFLNHHSFNGIYRVNRQGKYNVPFGHRPRLYSPSLSTLAAAASKLSSARLTSGDFAEKLSIVQRRDLVFLDPPYATELSGGFVKYNPVTFSWSDQSRLQHALEAIRSKGAYFVLSNANDSQIQALFETTKTQEATVKVSRGNSIGGLKAPRGSVAELIFTNLPGALDDNS